MSPRGAHRVRLAAAAALILLSAGCARVFGSYDIAPSGLPTGEDRLRVMLSSGQASAALERLDRHAPDDEVLHVLYDGVLAYHAGDYARSAQMLDIAGYLADDRITKSVSRSALSLVSNDLVLPYEPGRTERLMIPYYAALARTQLGDRAGAAVEARRLSLLLQQYSDAGHGVDASLAAMLHTVAAAMFEADDDPAAAAVAWRNAVALDSSLTHQSRGGSAPPGTGSIYVIVESGFVSHRVEQGLAVMLLPEEVYAIANGSSDDRFAASGFVAARILDYAAFNAAGIASVPYGTGSRGGTFFVPAPEQSLLPKTRTRTVCQAVTDTAPAGSGGTAADTSRGSGVVPVRATTRQECTEREEEIDELPYLLKVAWPVLTADRDGARSVRLLGSGDTVPALAGASISRGVRADFERERMLIVARTIARGTAKLALTKGAERKIEEQNELAGRIVGLLGNVGNVLLERADTRSWHLLPAVVSVVRVDLPAGSHSFDIEVGGRSVTLTGVGVAAGRTSVVSVRSW
jgi:hypothetical protein